MDKIKKKLSRKANNCKESIKAHAEEFLCILYPAMQHLDKIDRMEGPAYDMKRAALDMIGHFTIAYHCPEVRLKNIQLMFADYAKLNSTFILCARQGLFYENERFKLASRIEKMDEGIDKWHSAVTSAQRQVGGKVGFFGDNEARVHPQD